MSDFEAKMERHILKLAEKCEENKKEITELKFEMYRNFADNNIRVTRVESDTASIKDHLERTVIRIEATVKELITSQTNTSKEMTSVLTKIGIFSAIAMVIVSAFMSKFLG